MIPCEYDDKPITYIDPMKIVHTGVIVGQDESGEWLYVQSDRPNVKPAEWHFRILKNSVGAFLRPPDHV